MSQKYIRAWAWGHNELWMDMRRYHYTDIDPVSGTQVFRGFTPPRRYIPTTPVKIVQRIRPRYNSEYVWNRAPSSVIGGLDLDYHTDPMWIPNRDQDHEETFIHRGTALCRRSGQRAETKRSRT